MQWLFVKMMVYIQERIAVFITAFIDEWEIETSRIDRSDIILIYECISIQMYICI